MSDGCVHQFLVFLVVLAGVSAALLLIFIMYYGLSTIEDRRNGRNDKRDGWILRPFIRLVCGAVYGHEYLPSWYYFDKNGNRHQLEQCRYCGKMRKMKEERGNGDELPGEGHQGAGMLY